MSFHKISKIKVQIINLLTDVDVSSFAEEIMLWANSSQTSELFMDIIQNLKFPTELQNSDFKTLAAGLYIPICTICTGTLKAFIDLRRKGESEENIRNNVIKLCVLLNIQKEEVCRGVVDLNLPIILYIVDSRPNLEASTMCGVVLESKSCPLNDTEFEWSIDITNNTHTTIIENNTQEQIKVLQLSDIHYDPLYEPDGNTKCGEPVCCRKGQNKTDVTSAAGFWGDYDSCDTPWHAIVDVINHAKVTHQDIDFVYFTGDIIDHGVWETSKEGNIQSLRKIYNEIHDVFNDTAVYPIFGNHEPNPLNQFAPQNITQENLTTNWVYELLADLWIAYKWLPESTRPTILKGGYYTVTPRKGFRVIALNSNVCYSYNWWLWYTPRDPDDQLQWLVNVLSDAEKNNEFVHILSHIPANSNSCLSTWRREYLRIINRFTHIIKAEFNGHTHNDEIAIFYNSDSKVINVAWNGGSVTTYTKLNPNYKVYTVNSSNYAVTDYENWMYDLGSANKHNDTTPAWYVSYSFKKEYNLPDLSANSLNNWLYETLRNDTLLDKYYRNFYKLAQPSLVASCDVNCKRELLHRAIVGIEPSNIMKNVAHIGELWLGWALASVIGQAINTSWTRSL
ncbi:sphingomyelin phosphodiesterase 1-like isoform X2 [Ceratina calcarata]|uniref:Sphingomyelin phosphodiesterase n=1 Tax=Ceratina calcarata TaxID=156304 RepID=A0AAJ7J6A8_9HYME|nr:sphingomyelin phosphodiesterase 1-like isoform X2 [Ceratina calcarata]